MDISAHGIAFSAYNARNNKIAVENKEENSFDNELNRFSYKSTTHNINSIKTYFKDPTNDKEVMVSLNQETINKLEKHFGEESFIKKDDGSIQLTAEAEEYVANWFADIAYNRKFLEADRNNDGRLTENEYNNTNNDFNVEFLSVTESFGGKEKLLLAREEVTKQYSRTDTIFNEQNYRKDEIVKSLDDELNKTIEIDKDFDSKITLKEAFSTKEGKNFEDVILGHLEEFGVTTTPSDLNTQRLNGIINNSSYLDYIRNLIISGWQDQKIEEELKESKQDSSILTKDLSGIKENDIEELKKNPMKYRIEVKDLNTFLAEMLNARVNAQMSMEKHEKTDNL